MEKIVNLGVLVILWCLMILPCYASSKSESRTLQIHVNVEPVFLVDVAPKTGGDTLEFGTVKLIPEMEARTEEVSVDINVLSNMGVPYQVSQVISGPLVNPEGETLSFESLMIEANDALLGRGNIPNLQAVTPQGELLFESNAEGESDRFTVNYLLKIPPLQSGGDYRANLVYTIATKE